MEQKILLLGHTGMLGNMVMLYFKSLGIGYVTTHLRYPSNEFEKMINGYDFIINCIGRIPQRHDTFDINFNLPIALENKSASDCKIIYPGSDCEDDNTPYGKSKKRATNWIKNNGSKTKIIKTSVIGPEYNSNYGLLEWFLSQKKEVSGYSEFYWNGITTLEYSKKCLDIIKNWNDYETETIMHSECISKYDLLKIIKELFSKDIYIKKTEKPSINRCLYGGIETDSIKKQLIELKQFMKEQTWRNSYR